MTINDDQLSGTRILTEGIREPMFKMLGIKDVIGPPMAYFETGTGPDGSRHIYVAYRYGTVTEEPVVGHNGVNVPGRYKEFADLFTAVTNDLVKRLNPGKPLVWRTLPQVVRERGYLKAYFRFVQVDSQEQADEAVALVAHKTCPKDADGFCAATTCPLFGKVVL